MIIGLIIGMLLIALVSQRIGKILPQEMAMMPLILMLAMDGILIFCLKEFSEIENRQIAVAIMIATLVKVMVLIFTLPKEK